MLTEGQVFVNKTLLEFPLSQEKGVAVISQTVEVNGDQNYFTK